jgi:hypothetical protein
VKETREVGSGDVEDAGIGSDRVALEMEVVLDLPGAEQAHALGVENDVGPLV